MRIVEESLNTAEVANEYLNTQSKIKNFDMNSLEQCVLEAFEVPNYCLPEEFHNKTTGNVSLAKIKKLCDKRDGISTHDKIKQEKARRVEIYRKQIEENGEINFI